MRLTQTDISLIQLAFQECDERSEDLARRLPQNLADVYRPKIQYIKEARAEILQKLNSIVNIDIEGKL